MITAFTVKNFKAIGEEPVRIELKPITLLFGANSAGKSSILHALHYANEIFNNRNPDIEKITLGENNSLDLGGFQCCVHDKDINRSILLRFEFNYGFYIKNLKDSSNRLSSIPNFLQLLYNTTTAYVEVDISWSHITQLPYVSRYEVGINGERMAIIRAKSGGSKVALRYFNTAHPIFSDFWIEYGNSLDYLVRNFISSCHYFCESENQKIDNIQNYESNTPEKRRQIFKQFGQVPRSAYFLSLSTDNFHIRLSQNDALPRNWKYQLQFDDRDVWDTIRLKEECEDGFLPDSDLEAEAEAEFISKELKKLLDMILILPGQEIANFLERVCYLGPLREIPPRYSSSNNYHAMPKHILSRRWVTGLGAWDTLYSIGQEQFYELYESVQTNDNDWTTKKELDSWYINNWDKEGTIPHPDDHRLIKKREEKEKNIQTLSIINEWISGKNRLNTGYKIRIELYREISSDHPSFMALTACKSVAIVRKSIKEILRFPEKIRIWLHDESRNLNLTPHDIGVGISQVLPVVVAAVAISEFEEDNGTIYSSALVAIEQPELHIHPAVQVQLGDLFITQSSKNKFFLIETHSEHLLLRVLRRIRETAEGKTPDEFKILPNEVAVYYVESENGITQANSIGLDQNGRFTDRWPRGFFEEREKEYFGEQEDLSDELGRLFGQ